MTDKLAANNSKNILSKKGEGAPDASLTTGDSKNKDYPTIYSVSASERILTDKSMNNSSEAPKNHPEDEQSEVPPDILRIDKKILALKKKKERIQTQKALLFMKETQKIFNEGMSPNLALLILNETWDKASQSQKEEWQKRARSFRVSSPQLLEKKTQ